MTAGTTGSLRSEMDQRRANGVVFSLPEAIAIIVPLCTDLAQHHAQGARLFVHPSSILLGPGPTAGVAVQLALSEPAQPRDRACMAPEERHGKAGDARASVFAIGAILYELLIGESVGPGMRRPTELLPDLDPMVETVLGKALVADRAHRPDDLAALAQAIYHLAPGASLAPPPANEDHLAVDVSLSMLPPQGSVAPPQAAPQRLAPSARDPYGMPVVNAPAPRTPVYASNDPTTRLVELKARLEADPRPRYVVVKDGMDHGPFNGVEVLQQIGTHAFEEEHLLRDTFSNDERPIKDWPEFAIFAEHAKRNREIVAEKQEIARVVVAEAKGTRAKTLVGIVAIAGLLAGGGYWFHRARGERSDAIAVATDEGITVENAGNIKGKSLKKKGHGVSVGANGIPVLSGGMTCEQARARYTESIDVGGPRGQADITAGQYGAILNNGSYISACGTPGSMHVTVCAAVQNGHAVGVTVSTEPPNAGIANCITSAVRRMSFPSNPKLDVATTRF